MPSAIPHEVVFAVVGLRCTHSYHVGFLQGEGVNAGSLHLKHEYTNECCALPAGPSTAYSHVSADLKSSLVKDTVGLLAEPFMALLPPPAKAASQQ